MVPLGLLCFWGRCSLVVERVLRKHKVAGSIPVAGFCICARALPKLRDMRTRDGEVPLPRVVPAPWPNG